MTNPSLSAVYRDGRAEDVVWDAERLAGVLGGQFGSRDLRDDALGALADSPLNARVLRVALSLGSEAEALSAAVREVRVVPVVRRLRHSWVALAASVFAAALLVSLKPAQDAVPSTMVEQSPAQTISALSFEGATSVAVQKQDEAPIFVADFDT